jgi:hypothetical protein
LFVGQKWLTSSLAHACSSELVKPQVAFLRNPFL